MQKPTQGCTLTALIFIGLVGLPGCRNKAPHTDQASLNNAQLIEKGEEAFYQGRYDKALELYQNALQPNPSSADLYNRIGMTLRFLQNQNPSEELMKKEIEAFKQAVELDPKFTAAWINLGSSCFQAGKKETAAKALNQALILMPSHPDAQRIKQLINQIETPSIPEQ